jgi:hypothetical protein
MSAVAAVQRIAEVLAEHQIQDGPGTNLGQYRTEYTCECGAPVVTDVHAEVSLLAARVTHQAEALLAAGVSPVRPVSRGNFDARSTVFQS